MTHRRLVRARRAVAVLFLLNALAYANVVPRLPAIKAELDLSNTQLGLAVAAIPLGALLSGAVAGWLVSRLGSARLAVASGVGFGLILPGFALAPSWSALVVVCLLLGALDAWMDVSMNAHALRVERGYGRSIINGLHGLWSIGAVLGGLAGTAAAVTRTDLELHLLLAGTCIVAATLLVRPWLLPGSDDVERQESKRGAPGDRGRTARRALALLGLVAVLSAVVEDASQSWAAVLMRSELETSAGVAGLVYLGFQTAMTVGRLLGDRVVDRIGTVAVVRGGGLLTAVGITSGLLVAKPVAVIAGFVMAGLGTATLFPLAFQAAGDLPGVSTGYGVAVVAWLGRIGFFLAPAIVGIVGDATSLRVGLVLAPMAGLAVAALAARLRPAAARSG